MTKYEIMHMDPDKYQLLLEKQIFDQIETISNINKGHSKDLHIQMTDEEMITRLIAEEKSAVSCFDDQEELLDSIADGIYFKAKDITDWILSSHLDFTNKQDYHAKIININIWDDKIGSGFVNENGKIKEKESGVITIILQRDFSDESAFGFFVKTAYVNIEDRTAKYTGKEFNRKEILSNENIIFSSDIKRTYYYEKTNIKKPEYLKYKTDSGKEYMMYINEKNPQNNIIIYFEKDEINGTLEINIKEKSKINNHIQKISLMDCMNRYPEIMNKITKINQSYDMAKQTHIKQIEKQKAKGEELGDI